MLLDLLCLNRSSDVELDFDFDAVKEKSKDNPLYYVQYCYARISSVFRHLDKDLTKDVIIDNYNFEYSDDEIKILKKISEWPKCIDAASTKLEPHRIPIYLYELASQNFILIGILENNFLKNDLSMIKKIFLKIN